MYGSRIVLADSDPAFRKYLKDRLTRDGYLVIADVEDGRSALQVSLNMQPDLLITEARLPGMDGLEVAASLEQGRNIPVLLISSASDSSTVERARESWVFGYLVKPINEANLYPAVEMAIANCQRILRTEKESREYREKLEKRKVIERAKGILMKTMGLSEAEAFRRIQQQSMKNRTSMHAIAEAIITASEFHR